MAKSRQISVAETGSINVVTQSLLEGQDLGGLATATTPHGLVSTQAFDLPRDDVYLTAAETARFLGVAKSTVTRRIEKAGLIGFRVFKNALRIPRDQFKNGDVVDGVPNILALFEIVTEGGETAVDHKGAWAFLNSTIYPGDTAPRPIDRLRTASSRRPTKTVVAELALAKQSLDYGDHI